MKDLCKDWILESEGIEMVIVIFRNIQKVSVFTFEPNKVNKGIPCNQCLNSIPGREDQLAPLYQISKFLIVSFANKGVV